MKYLSKLLFILCSLILITGCGYKSWPTAINTEYQYRFTSIDANIIENYLQLKIKIEGNIDNLESITLQIESDGDCKDCPFLPYYQKRFTLYGQDQLSINGSLITIFDYNVNVKNVRLRLLGHNKYVGQPVVVSNIIITK